LQEPDVTVPRDQIIRSRGTIGTLE